LLVPRNGRHLFVEFFFFFFFFYLVFNSTIIGQERERGKSGVGRRVVNVIANRKGSSQIDGQTDGQSSHDRAALTQKKKNIYIYCRRRRGRRSRETSTDNEGLPGAQ
jgi:hypothetical protein